MMNKRLICFPIFLLLLLITGLTGLAYGEETDTCLDLTSRPDAPLEDIVALIDQAGDGLTEADLTGTFLSLEDRKSLMARYPDLRFIWTWDLWGVTVSSRDTVFSCPVRAKKKAQELCDLLDLMPGLKTVDTPHINMSREDRDRLYFSYPDVFFYWDLQINKAHRFATDVTAFSTLGRAPKLYKNNTHSFIYCKNLKALDIGHNPVEELTFLEQCPKLKIFIGACCLVKDVTPVGTQTDLEYLELFSNKITDISPLSSLVNLRDLNLSNNDISDISPLYGLPKLERVWLFRNDKIPQEQLDRFRELHPDCELVTRARGATGNKLLDGTNESIPNSSWRHHPRYDSIYYIFHNSEYVSWDHPVPEGKLKKNQ